MFVMFGALALRLEINLRKYWSNKKETLSKKLQMDSTPSWIGQRF